MLHRTATVVATILVTAGCGSAATKTSETTHAARAPAASPPARSGAAGTGRSTGSTPQSFTVPQAGRVSFRCGSENKTVQPFYDANRTTAEDKVTISAGALVRRNYVTRVVGRNHGHALTETRISPAAQLALPYGDYRTVVFTIEQGTEARIIHARVVIEFSLGASGRLSRCFVHRWTAVETVS